MIYTFYTKSHKVFLDDWFLKTLPKSHNKHLVVKEFKQECESGSFMSSGWNKTMLNKVNYIIECLDIGEPFFHLDSDIQFFGEWYDEYMEILKSSDIDILAQSDGGLICCGFMGINPSEKMKKVFEEVYELTESGKAEHDQAALNMLRNKHNIKVKLLGEECFSIWRSCGGVWNPSMGVTVPKNIKMHHANYVVGIKDKIELMKLVRNNAK